MKTLEKHNYTGIDATIIADSKNEHGERITTFVVTCPRIVLAEFNTHRMFSRNSASSRAIPFYKMLEKVTNHPFIPIKWMKDHKGMQGNVYFETSESEAIRLNWEIARDNAIQQATMLSKLGLTKQIVNRLLEPFMWHTIIVTATEWSNFFALRDHEAAEIHIADLAHKMRTEYRFSTPKQLKAGEWHIPFGDNIDITDIDDNPNSWIRIKIATARCARVSYDNFDGTDDYAKDIALHDRLSSMGHWSPFEHCAQAMTVKEYETSISGEINAHAGTLHEIHTGDMGWSGNFKGFVQYRKTFENENIL